MIEVFSEVAPVLLGCVLLYFAMVLLVARFFSRKTSNLTDFFLAGRSLTAWPVALSFLASWFGASCTIGSLNAYHRDGVSAAWLIAIPSLVSCVVIARWLARRVASTRTLSQPEAIEQAYGPGGRFFLALVLIGYVVTFIGAQLVAAGSLFQGVLNLDVTTATLAVVGVVVLYSMVGGYFAVVVTDVLQCVFFSLALVVLAVWVGMGLTQHPEALANLAATQPASYWDMGEQLPHHMVLFVTFVLAWSIAPEMWQRMSSTRNAEQAQKASVLAMMMMAGLFLLVAAMGILSPAVLSGPSQRVLLDITATLPHPFWMGVVLVGVLAAITSTMDSAVNIGSLTLTRDLYQGFFRKTAGDSELLWVSRVATFLVALPAIGIALLYRDIITILWVSADIYACTMVFPVLGLLYLKNPGRWSGLLAMVLGGATVCISFLVRHDVLALPFPWPEAPYSALLGIGMNGLGFGIGYGLHRMMTRRKGRGAMPGAGAFVSAGAPVRHEPDTQKNVAVGAGQNS